MNRHLYSTFLILAVIASAAHAQIPLSDGLPYTQNFNGMTTGDPFPNCLEEPADPPTGWTFEGNGANYGELADRALGIDRTPFASFGAEFLILSGHDQLALEISFTGEQWYQTSGSAGSAVDFEWSTDASSLSNGTWNPFDPFDFQRLGPTQPLGDQCVNGNDSVYRQVFSGTIVADDVPDHSTVWIRWTGVTVDGRHDGLAVDDFSITSRSAVVFSDGFESGDTDAWSQTSN